MVNEDIDLVTVAKTPKKKSLLERYDMPVENLSYEYVTQCTQVKELERIILILRSGEEGIYPDLLKHTEDRLAVLKPQSAVLRVAEPVLTKNMLAPEKRKKLENDINEWMSEMKLREKDLQEGRATLINDANSQPDIRQIKFDESKKKQQSSHDQRERKRIGACDYVGWDKYDADTEINRIDLQTEKKQAEAKRNQKKICDREERMKKASTEVTINKRTLTGTELTVLAEQEREKGNEAFKAGDYEEALQFYNSSISIDPTLNGYNNRAMTCVKLRRYNEAVNDCNIVISMDHMNIKALLRRGLAFEHLEKIAEALADYETVLKLESTNKVAIAALNKLRQPCDSKKIRMKIEEKTETDEKRFSPEESTSNSEKSINSRVCRTFEHNTTLSQHKSVSSGFRDSANRTTVESTSKMARSQVCFCNNAPGSSQHSSPLPHIRNGYCSEAPNKSIASAESRSIFVDTKISAKKSSVVIEEIPNEHYEEPAEKCVTRMSTVTATKLRESNATLKTFGFDDNEKIGKKSTVVVEEIGGKSSAIVEEIGDKSALIAEEIGEKSSAIVEEIGDKSAVISEEIGEKSSAIVDEIVDKSAVVAEKIGEKSSAIAEEIGENSSATVEKIGEKSAPIVEKTSRRASRNAKKILKSKSTEDERRNLSVANTNSNVDTRTEDNGNIGNEAHVIANDQKSKDNPNTHFLCDKKFDKIESPYEFLRLWHSLKSDPDLLFHGILLKALAPNDIDTGNKLDGEMLSIILRCLERHFSTPEDTTLLYRFLQSLAKVQRFSLIRMFMDANDRKVLQTIFSMLEAQASRDDIEDLRRTYELSL